MKCKDCFHNGKCKFQDEISTSKVISKNELENSSACAYFVSKVI